MRRSTGVRVLLSVLCLFVVGAAVACKKGPDDAAIAAAVKAKMIADSPATAAAISVATTEGVVTLTGAVDSEAVKAKAQQLAKSVEGVKSVTNNLTVKPPLVFSPDQTLKNTIMSNLAKAAISSVTVDVVNGEVTLKGTIERAKLQDAMKAANDAKPKKVNNQLVIK